MKKKLMIIESYTFNSNSNLRIINEYAFRNCINLKEIQLPKSLKKIDFKKVFENCTEIKIEIEEENEYLTSNEGVLLNQNKSELIQYPIGNQRTSNTIPEETERIRIKSLSNCYKLENIEVNENNQYFISIDEVLFDYDKTK